MLLFLLIVLLLVLLMIDLQIHRLFNKYIHNLPTTARRNATVERDAEIVVHC
jgi:hypothetical protein